jgi:hypothetical protein
MINNNTGEEIKLLIQHIFGRHSSTSHTVLHNPDASRMHATILWDGENWLIQDLSSNGTFVNGNPVLRGSMEKLNKGDKIHFASLAGDTWEMLDVDPPKSLLVPITSGLQTIELESIIVLPNEELAEVTLYQSLNGHWVCESQSGISVLKTGDLVGSEGLTWRFIEARASEETTYLISNELPSSPQVGIFFNVSQNEEHVSFKFKMGDHVYDLGKRNHHYLMLLLARKRLEDRKNGVSTSEQGWMDKDQLCKMLGLNENHINILVYRFRKQVISLLPRSLNFPQAIERRTCEIRFAYEDIEISGGTVLDIVNDH